MFISVAAILTIYLARVNPVAGQVVDDAWYVMLAKGLASGEGYRLINAPAPFVLPMYPPGFPAILSMVFRVVPEFPQNVWLLKGVSIVATLAAGVLTFQYASKYRGLPPQIAAFVSAALVLMPAFVFLATSTVMSECAFTLLQLGAVVLLHETAGHRGRSSSIGYAAAAGVAVAAAILVRSAGWMALGAGLLWLIVSERLRREAVVFAAVTFAVLSPWTMYMRAHATPLDVRLTHGGSIVHSYPEQFWMRWAGAPSSGSAQLADLPARVLTNATDVFGRATAGQIMPMIFRGPAESGEEVVALGGAVGISAASMGNVAAAQGISLAISTVMFIGYLIAVRQKPSAAEYLVPLSLGLTLLWPFWSFRFVLPLAPYLLVYFTAGLHWIGRHTVVQNGDRWRLARIALLSVLGLHGVDHAGYVLHAKSGARGHDEWVVTAQDAEEMLSWMSQNLQPGLVATTNPALVHLRTGFPTITLDRMTERWDLWRGRGVRYVASVRPLDLPPDNFGRYTLMYRSRLGAWVIELRD